MTPLYATAAQIRNSGPANGTGLALLAERTPPTASRAQPVRKIHEPLFRARGQQAYQDRFRGAQRAPGAAPEALDGRQPRQFLERLSPVAKFGDSAPAMAQIIAHESGFLRAFMPNEMRAFSRDAPTRAYQATLDRSRQFMMDYPPLDAAA